MNRTSAAPATENLNVAGIEPMPSPHQLKSRLPLGSDAAQTVLEARRALRRILDREDERLFVIAGPCSVHDPHAALEYARRLRDLALRVHERICVVMRVYFEKPRTVSGWKGFINDPRMDDSFHIEEGIGRARQFLIDLARMGVPAATEALDPISPQYLGDLVAWYAIGARTSESQTHREMASALSAPVGFKNGTDGDIMVAVNGIRSARLPHSFLGIDPQGLTAVVRSRGNRYGHVVLRGGATPNYDSAHVALCEQALDGAGLPKNIVIDCSHGNSFRKPELQPLVFRDCIHQIAEGKRSIVGLMLESNLVAGSQPIPEDLSKLVYGCSVTDPCIGWETTEEIVLEAAALAAAPRRGRPWN
ncbi:MAG: 3-deoxy-7-phosphoheptulonate synthase [Burkholderiales bacterium]|nr:3-deoxy-7-phosphoheptulonate synthase [Burkholderiales bacterium]